MNTRDMPNSVEAERALLGGLMERPELMEQPELLTLTPSHFYRQDHRALFALLQDMRRQGEPIDMITVPMRAGRQDDGRPFGGVQYVTELPHHCVATANLPSYAKQIQDDWVWREILGVCHRLEEDAYEAIGEPGRAVSRARNLLDTLGAGAGASHWVHASEAAMQVLDDLDRVEAGDIPGTLTGFASLDDHLVCMGNGELIILAARPSMGKSALAANISERVAHSGKGVAIYSLEMSSASLAMRGMAAMADVGVKDIRKATLTQEQGVRVIEAANDWGDLPIMIDHRSGLTIEEITAGAHRVVAEFRKQGIELGLLVVDYLQLIEAQGYDARTSSVQKYTHISKCLKRLARNLDIPVLALAQLNRAVDHREDKRPMMSDIRESGGIEQDADVIMFIYRDEQYNPESIDRGYAEVIIRKSRNADANVTVPLRFWPRQTRFEDLSAEFIKEWRRQRQ